MSILSEIVEQRRERVRKEGHGLGVPVPKARRVPVQRFGLDPFLIAEIKRRSPSKGWIAEGLDAMHQARAYRREGVANISVLTEMDHFAGSLRDLMDVKTMIPEAAVLRKDFLLDEEDIVVSHRAGADAVLLIASILSAKELAALHALAQKLGMEAMVEVHDEEDCAKASRIRPSLVGINCRDLATFTVDLLLPVRMRRHVTWPARLVFESGIKGEEDALFALSSGFSGLLAGEAVVRDARLARGMLDAFGRTVGDFWRRVCERQQPRRPLVKICGLTREEDARLAAEYGADVLGFVFAHSPRQADASLLDRVRDIPVLKVAVVARGTDDGGTAIAARLLADGSIDAVQFHGDEGPDDCFASAFPYYRAMRAAGREDIERIGGFRCPRVLIDAYVPQAAGGTGTRVPDDLIAFARENHPLWLAGGIRPDNVRDILARHSPELIDVSSGLEAAPGRKDPDKIKALFKEIDRDAGE